MKKILKLCALIASFAMALSFISCGNDDDDTGGGTFV